MINVIKKYVSISKGNIKLGAIHNISLPPILTCIPNAPCAKDCYARKAHRQYPIVVKAHTKNLYTYYSSPRLYERCVNVWLNKMKPKFFRWHVAGDIPDKPYRGLIRSVALSNTDVNFLVFTKKYDMFTNRFVLPDNLKIVFSAWPGLDIPKTSKFPIAWMDDGTDDRIPEKIFECAGYCESCMMCWNLDNNHNVKFNKH